jgi:hypothetical protein
MTNKVLKEHTTDTDLHMLQARRRRLEEERAHLFPHIPLVEGVLEKALDPEMEIKVTSRTLIYNDSILNQVGIGPNMACLIRV